MDARLEEIYKTKLRAELKKTLSLKNIMQVPRLKKIVLKSNIVIVMEIIHLYGMMVPHGP